MKKLFFLFALFGLFATSCEESNIQEPNTDNPIENPDDDNEEKPVFTVESDDTILIEADGGEFDVLVTTNLEYNVVIDKESQSWVSVADTRAVRKEKLTFTIAPNEEPEERSATIRLTDKNGNTLQSFVIVQEAIEGIFEDNANDKYTISADGGTVEVAVTTNLEYNVVIDKESQSWVSVADTRAVRKEKLTFTIAPNEELEERSATIRLTDKNGNTLQSFVIVQEAIEGIFEDNANDKYTISADGGTVEVAVTTNLEYNVVIDKESQSWVSVADTRAVRKEKLTFTIAANEQYVSRVATISLIDKDKTTLETFTIEQLPASCASNELIYTSTDGQPIYVDVSAIGVVMTENIYENGVGVMRFNGIITTIPNELFYNCKNLKSIILPESIAKIGSKAFYGCSNLDKIVLGENIKSFGDTAFVGCTGEAIVNCNIGNASEYNYGVFYNAEFTKVIIGDSVTTIGQYAFYDCDSLTSVTIGNSVTTIGAYAFEDCNSLKEFKGKFAADNGRCLIKDNTLIAYAKASGTTYTIPDSVTKIGERAFYSCDSLTSVTIPDSVTTIGGYAFSNCDSLTSVTIGKGVTSFGAGVFVGCKGELIINSNIPNVSSSEDSPFYNSKFTKVIIGDSVTTIGKSAFASCDSLTSVSIGKGVTSFGAGVFAGCKGELIINSNIPNVSSSKYSPFYNSKFTKVIIGDSVTTIGQYAFYDCDSLTSVTIGDSVTTIGDYAFGDCNSLKEFKGKFAADNGRCLIIDGVLNAFALGCGATQYTIPDSVTTIGNYAFCVCDSLTSVTIGNSVTTIGGHAFYDCDSLTRVTISDSVTTIGDCAFRYCDSLTSVTIGNSVTTIGACAFEDCNRLTSVTIPDSVTTIGAYAFGFCDRLTRVTISDSVTTIGNCAFYCCESLTSVTIGNSVKTIGDFAFYDCISLTSVTIPDSVTKIGERAFEFCSSLTFVFCKPTTPPTGGNRMFHYNASGHCIYVPASDDDSIIKAYKAASCWRLYCIFESSSF